jgi:Mor family transcriptional regulator
MIFDFTIFLSVVVESALERQITKAIGKEKVSKRMPDHARTEGGKRIYLQ